MPLLRCKRVYFVLDYHPMFYHTIFCCESMQSVH